MGFGTCELCGSILAGRPGAELLSLLWVNRVGTKIVNVCSGQRAERNLRREALICVGVALDKRGARAQSR